MSALGIFGAYPDTLLQMLQDCILTLMSRTILPWKHQILPSDVLTTFIANAISNGHVLTYLTFNAFIFTPVSLFIFFPIVVTIFSFKCY